MKLNDAIDFIDVFIDERGYDLQKESWQLIKSAVLGNEASEPVGRSPSIEPGVAPDKPRTGNKNCPLCGGRGMITGFPHDSVCVCAGQA